MSKALVSALTSAALISAPVMAQGGAKPTPALTLTNLKGPISDASGKAPATSIPNLWDQILGLPKFKPPVVIDPIILDPIDPKQITPIAENFDPQAEGLLYKGGVAQKGYKQGAFRFTCWPTDDYNYDDSIIAPGKIGGSMHGHENFGNTLGNGKSNYLSLRTTGESTCHNKINRSHYWMPWMQNAKGEIVRSKLMTLYYKRWAKSDPDCLRKARNGCVDLSNGFRAISGYDPARLGQKQPENDNHAWRCNANLGNDQISEYRDTIDAAVADCKVDKYGKVEVIGSVAFGDCWNGKLDSQDHRSHLARSSYGSWGYEKCPAGYDYVIPALTEQVTFEILKGDGPLRLSCDVMGDKSVAGGVCLHADYREAWSPWALQRIHDVCINQILDCSFGSFGDGEYLLQQPNKSKLPRIIPAPTRPAT